jgi:hypothetical protein
MDGPAPAPREERALTPLLALAGLVLLPFLLLALFGGTPVPANDQRASDARAETAPMPVPDLPATGDDTVVLSDLPVGVAQARNAGVAFAAMGPGSASPFTFRGSAADRARARDCLALAGMAEAGGGDGDQRAVMQVILNRVRHPAFAGTVCGVVFEGSQRPTGCQFSFTCDGSLARRYSDAAWNAARARAEDMLGGATHAPVGNATHFHADYVYPWWSDRLDKVAKVGPHIFFRWRGFWGSRQALSARYAGGEPDPLRPIRCPACGAAARRCAASPATAWRAPPASRRAQPHPPASPARAQACISCWYRPAIRRARWSIGRAACARAVAIAACRDGAIPRRSRPACR